MELSVLQVAETKLDLLDRTGLALSLVEIPEGWGARVFEEAMKGVETPWSA
jgi:hypothetical protein